MNQRMLSPAVALLLSLASAPMLPHVAHAETLDGRTAWSDDLIDGEIVRPDGETTAQEEGGEVAPDAMAPVVSPRAEGDVPNLGAIVRTDEPRNRAHRSEIIALSTLTGIALAGGGVFLGLAHSARSDAEAIDGDLRIDSHRRSTLRLEQRSHQFVSYALIGTGLAAASGLVYLLVTRQEDGAEVSIAPSFTRAGAGLRFDASF